MLSNKIKKLNESTLISHIASPPNGSVVVEIHPDLAKFALSSTNKKKPPG